MMMKMLQAGGIPLLTDAVRQADTDNPEGYFEFERAKQLDKGDSAWLAQAKGKAVKVISALLPYLPDNHQYRVIFMERDLHEVLASQRKMLARRLAQVAEADDAKMATAFERHLRQTKSVLANRADMVVLYVDHRAVLSNPELQVRTISHFLQRPLRLEPMAGAVNTHLYRNRAG